MTSTADMIDTGLKGREDGSAPQPRPDDIVEHAQTDLSWWERASFDAVHGVMAAMVKTIGAAGVFRFGSLWAGLEWLINSKRRRRFREAMQAVGLEKDIGPDMGRACREFFTYSRSNRLFYLIFDSLTRPTIDGLVRFERRELLDDALKRGRGVYLAMSHVGPYQIGGMFMSHFGYRMAGVRDRNEGALSRYIQHRFARKYPESLKTKMFFNDAYPRVIFRCLKEGYVLGSAMDVSRVRRANLRTETVEVFGKPREFLTGPLHIAVRCGVPTIQAFILPEPDFRFHIFFDGPLYDPDSGLSEDEAVRRALHAYARNTEKQLRANPSHITRV